MHVCHQVDCNVMPLNDECLAVRYVVYVVIFTCLLEVFASLLWFYCIYIMFSNLRVSFPDYRCIIWVVALINWKS